MGVLQCMMTLFCLINIIQSKCIHDQLVKQGHKMSAVNDTHIHNQRLLQSLGYGPMRFLTQYDPLSVTDDNPIDSGIKRMMEIVVQFWSETIEIDYVSALSYQISSNFDPSKVKCLTFNVPERLIVTPTPNKDYGLLVEALDDGDNGITAFSYPCAYSNSTLKPLWGMIHWNQHYMQLNPLNFQQNLYIGIHQVLHIIGFSQALYSNYANQQIFVSNGNGAFLNGPYIRKQVQRQYGCNNFFGMSLQTNGGSGTAYSHWSRKTALNQLMTAGVSVDNPTISYITLALLQETGWYRKIYKTHGKFINFGYQKGCTMLNKNDCSSDEYCSVKDQKRPGYDQTSLGYCKNDSLTNCMYVKYYVNFICTDPNYASRSLHADHGVIKDTGQSGGMKSRCFESDLRLNGRNQTKYPFRCYQVLCTPSARTLTIKIGNKYAFCMFPNQQVRVSGYDGTLRCPQSFQRVCAIKRCPKECNANGICLNGRCLCAPKYTGEACDKLSSVGFASKANLFSIQQNNNCIQGSFLNEFGNCQICPKKCSKCLTFNVCQKCFGDRLPLNGQC